MNPQDIQLLAPLRPDLEFVEGPSNVDGSPSYMIHDLLHDTYNKASWAQIQVMKFLTAPISPDDLVRQINGLTTLSVKREDVLDFYQQLVTSGLTEVTKIQTAAVLAERKSAQKKSFFEILLHHYLYFRVPLINPDQFLEKTIGYLSFLKSSVCIWIYSLFALYGLLSVMQRFDEYSSTFQYFFNSQGLICYSLSIIFLKIIHEFSHAYFAKGYGNRVRTMGIAFIVMWPVCYCDVTDCWRMKSRSKRLLISFAGIIAEFAIAGISLFVWSIAPDGVIKSISFVLSSVTIVSTVLVNLNPAMRFDGYYIFSDLIGVDNLQQTSFLYTRELLFHIFLGTKMIPTNEYTLKQKVFFVCYSIYTWIYRIFLYVGIAVLVYYKFTKLLGIVLFSVEILWFLINPSIRIVKAMKTSARFSLNLIVTSIILVGLIIWAILPLDRTISFPAVTELNSSQAVFVPLNGVISSIGLSKGKYVTKGQSLLEIESGELKANVQLTSLKIEKLKQDIELFSIDKVRKKELPQRKEQLTEAMYELAVLLEMKKQCIVVADIDGEILSADESLRPGMSLSKNTAIAKIGDTTSIMLKAYVDEKYLDQVAIGNSVRYYPSHSIASHSALITKISPIRKEKIEYLALTSFNNGDIAVVGNIHDNAYNVVDSVYELDLSFSSLSSDEKLRIGQRGEVQLTIKDESLLHRLYSSVIRSLIRESSF